MDYFAFYEIPVSFKVDEGALKRIFYANSKKYHPDFYTLESEAKQAEILELSTLNNKAYQTLSDFDRRMKYVLDLKGVLGEEGKNTIPQDFLMEMMEVNEELMELEFDFDASKLAQVKTAITEKEASLYTAIASVVENYNATTSDDSELQAIKDYYLKKRYLLRIQENLSKFAAR
ncbi:MAG: Fe-S protein assembly co-chaperone HscB [Bacteroidota bacterium]